MCDTLAVYLSSSLSAVLLSFGTNLNCVTCKAVVPVAVNKVFTSSAEQNNDR